MAQPGRLHLHQQFARTRRIEIHFFDRQRSAVGVGLGKPALADDGGTANGGVDTSASQTFTITVTAVNDAPSFTKGANQTALEDAAAQTVTGWATAISAGPADESAQTVSFSCSNTTTALF